MDLVYGPVVRRALRTWCMVLKSRPKLTICKNKKNTFKYYQQRTCSPIYVMDSIENSESVVHSGGMKGLAVDCSRAYHSRGYLHSEAEEITGF